jgi:hypothetical protein
MVDVLATPVSWVGMDVHMSSIAVPTTPTARTAARRWCERSRDTPIGAGAWPCGPAPDKPERRMPERHPSAGEARADPPRQRIYNNERPHEAIDWQRPGDRYSVPA